MLGAIADDFTGATDLATMLRRSGHRVSVVIEDAELAPEEARAADAVVVALKTRTAPAAEAVRASLDALGRLRGWGADRFYVKYCSTFDSTDEGNIGPVLDAVGDALGTARTVVVPSLPANGRTVYQGHLFVGRELLEHSSMRNHPLTPMTRSRVADLLRPQTPAEVSEIDHATVRAGADDLRAALDAAEARYVVVDAIDDDDLRAIGAATGQHPLVSGGSGLALGIPGPHRPDTLWAPPATGRGAVLCGSVSRTTLAQIEHAARTQPVRQIDLAAAVADPAATAAELAAWTLNQDADSVPVVCAARSRDDVRASLDGTAVSPVVEEVLARTAALLVADGAVSALVVAGGESSGAVVRELGVGVLHIGPELAPGVCWAAAESGGRRIALALKSGNFGRTELFTDAWEALA
ncbi:3-oxo-tetronate kinase [Microbacterium marinilacus]|uniref:3-oxo-tetronate kinase n=1 Tax=Microbacterium marinilacus TaxID=415209 RepID=A0ABP7BII6_9MICO|nr:3-oxo-tetronate kinase [Microbacterium marinilacus]MBY0690321.1 four-carbon acid sugar kinase family protein [Microbacterium marinilacus]